TNSTTKAMSTANTRQAGVQVRFFRLCSAARQPSDIPKKLASRTMFVKNVKNNTVAGNQRMQANSRKRISTPIKNRRKAEWASPPCLSKEWKDSRCPSTGPQTSTSGNGSLRLGVVKRRLPAFNIYPQFAVPVKAQGSHAVAHAN